MKLLPAPLLSLSLLALWVMLQGSVDPGTVMLGALVAIMVPLMTQTLRPTRVRTSSTSSRNAADTCSTNRSPTSAPSRRTSSRRGRSGEANSMLLRYSFIGDARASVNGS